MYGLNTLVLYLLFSHHLEWLGNNLTQLKDKTKALVIVSFSAKICTSQVHQKAKHPLLKKTIILVSRVRLAEYLVLRDTLLLFSEAQQVPTEEEAPKI